MLCILDGRQITTTNAFIDALYAQLSPDRHHLGRNLDAVWDVLTTDIERPVTVLWTHAGASRAALGATAFANLALVLADVAARDVAAGYEDLFEFKLA